MEGMGVADRMRLVRRQLDRPLTLSDKIVHARLDDAALVAVPPNPPDTDLLEQAAAGTDTAAELADAPQAAPAPPTPNQTLAHWLTAGRPRLPQNPKVVGIHLTGRLPTWTTPKDLALKVLEQLHVATAAAVASDSLPMPANLGSRVWEFHGQGAHDLEPSDLQATADVAYEAAGILSVFSGSEGMVDTVEAVGQNGAATALKATLEELAPDDDAPYEQTVHINLAEVEPYVHGPLATPATSLAEPLPVQTSLAMLVGPAGSTVRHTPLSEFADRVREHGWSCKVLMGVIGGQVDDDIFRCAAVAAQAVNKGVTVTAPLHIDASSGTADRLSAKGYTEVLDKLGAHISVNAGDGAAQDGARPPSVAGPDSGQAAEGEAAAVDDADAPCSILMSCSSGTVPIAPGSHIFVASPEVVTAMCIAGRLTFNPLTDSLTADDGDEVFFDDVTPSPRE